MKKNIFLFLAMISCTTLTIAKNIEVKMLNTGPNNTIMVYSPSFVEAKVGDTVTFIPEQKGGHNVVSVALPHGVNSFKSDTDSKFVLKLEKEGLFAYACEPHKIMGMVGLIQVGHATNLEETRKILLSEEAKFSMNKDNYSKLLKLVK